MNKEDDVFSVDMCFDEEWLVNALATARAGGNVHATVVIRGGGRCTYKCGACGGGEAEYLKVCCCGDLMAEPWWCRKDKS